MSKVSLSIFGLQKVYGDKESLRIAKQIGCDAVDFTLDNQDYRNKNSVYAGGEAAVREYYGALREYAESIGLEIGQTHGRGPGFKNKKEEDDALVENARLDVIATAALGARYCVIHTTTTIFMGPDAPAELMHELNYEMFRRILPYAREHGVIVCTETFGDATGLGCCDFFGNIDEFVKGYERVCAEEDFADWFKICMDTGHSNKARRYNNNPTAGEVIRRLGGNIVCLHLHDNDGLTDQHKIPMTGTIDWNDVFAALGEVGYSGNYNAEIVLTHFGKGFEVEEAAFCVKVMKNMLKEKGIA